MDVHAYTTPKIVVGDNLFKILDHALPKLSEKSVVVVTSKIVSICEGRVVKNDGTVDKRELIHKEAQYYMEEECLPKYGIILTVKNDTLIASAGIDESNGNGYFILWPKDPAVSAITIWKYLRARNHIKNLGVIVSDSRTIPLRWGTLGLGIGWCGFEPLNNYIDAPDIFGRKLHVTKSSVLDGLAAAAVFVMGEGNEQTPLAIISDIPMVHFLRHPPTKKEQKNIHISLAEDIYSPLTNSKKWKKGGI